MYLQYSRPPPYLSPFAKSLEGVVHHQRVHLCSYSVLTALSSSVARQPYAGLGLPQKLPPFLSVRCYAPQFLISNVLMSCRTRVFPSHLRSSTFLVPSGIVLNTFFINHLFDPILSLRLQLDIKLERSMIPISNPLIVCHFVVTVSVRLLLLQIA